MKRHLNESISAGPAEKKSHDGTFLKCDHEWCREKGNYRFELLPMKRSEEEWLELAKQAHINIEDASELSKQYFGYRIYRGIEIDDKLCEEEIVLEDLWTVDRQSELYDAIVWVCWYFDNKAFCLKPEFLKEKFVPPQGT